MTKRYFEDLLEDEKLECGDVGFSCEDIIELERNLILSRSY